MSAYRMGWWPAPALLALVLMVATACDSGASPTATLDPTPTATAMPTPTATSTPEPEPGSVLLETLANLPASFKERGIWFGDMGRAFEMAGVSPPASMEELRAMSDADREAYTNALSDVVNVSGLLTQIRMDMEGWEETFGFGYYDVTLTMSTGDTSTTPVQPYYLEGDFDEDAIRQRLVDLGYEEVEASGETYYTLWGDRQWGDLKNPAARLAMGRMNRVWVGEDTLITAPATEMMTEILGLWRARCRHWRMTPPSRAWPRR